MTRLRMGMYVSGAYNPTMARVTPEEAQAYARRWVLLQEFEAAEMRRTSMDTRLRQLSALMASRELFATEPDRELQVQAVRERWARLRQAFGA
jgi:hypothetical protein